VSIEVYNVITFFIFTQILNEIKTWLNIISGRIYLEPLVVAVLC